MTLILLPNLVSHTRNYESVLPAGIEKIVQSLDGLICESEAGARRFLSLFKLSKKTHEVPVCVYKDEDIDFILEPIKKGETWGFISDAGLPCIADPGYKLVNTARRRGVKIQAVSGPSSLFLALMLSGLPGQKFEFHGYMDRDPQKYVKTLSKGVTHIFIEAPYRNDKLLEALISSLALNTQLSVAWDLTMPSESVMTHTMDTWKKIPKPSLNKKPAIFLMHQP